MQTFLSQLWWRHQICGPKNPRSYTTSIFEPFKVYIMSQILSIPMLIGLLGYCLVDIDYDVLDANSAESPWSQILSSSSYPGGVFNYLSKFFHYYLQTNIFFVTLLPAFLYFVIFATSSVSYHSILSKIRNYEFLSYRTRYTKFFGEYTWPHSTYPAWCQSLKWMIGWKFQHIFLTSSKAKISVIRKA